MYSFADAVHHVHDPLVGSRRLGMNGGAFIQTASNAFLRAEWPLYVNFARASLCGDADPRVCRNCASLVGRGVVYLAGLALLILLESR